MSEELKVCVARLMKGLTFIAEDICADAVDEHSYARFEEIVLLRSGSSAGLRQTHEANACGPEGHKSLVALKTP
jgi:hypothetical protein